LVTTRRGVGCEQSHARPCHDRNVLAAAGNSRFSKRDQVIVAFRHKSFGGPQVLVLQEHDRIVATN
jgi:hypothetical protein